MAALDRFHCTITISYSMVFDRNVFALRATQLTICTKTVPQSINVLIYSTAIQWNPYIVDTIEELHVGRYSCRYRGPAVAEGFSKYNMNEIRT